MQLNWLKTIFYKGCVGWVHDQYQAPNNMILETSRLLFHNHRSFTFIISWLYFFFLWSLISDSRLRRLLRLLHCNWRPANKVYDILANNCLYCLIPEQLIQGKQLISRSDFGSFKLFNHPLGFIAHIQVLRFMSRTGLRLKLIYDLNEIVTLQRMGARLHKWFCLLVYSRFEQGRDAFLKDLSFESEG